MMPLLLRKNSQAEMGRQHEWKEVLHTKKEDLPFHVYKTCQEWRIKGNYRTGPAGGHQYTVSPPNGGPEVKAVLQGIEDDNVEEKQFRK